MKKISIILLTSILALTGCMATQGNLVQENTNQQVQQNSYSRYGKVVNVKSYISQKTDNNPLAIAGGALLGGILGHQIGGGTGKDLATIAGAGAGAYAANQYSQKSQNISMVELQIKDDNGAIFTVNQNKNYNFYMGQRVIITTKGYNNLLITPY